MLEADLLDGYASGVGEGEGSGERARRKGILGKKLILTQLQLKKKTCVENKACSYPLLTSFFCLSIKREFFCSFSLQPSLRY